MNLDQKTVVVTGGAGFIGSHVVDHLVREREAKVIVFDDLSVGERANLEASPQAELIVGDIRDREATQRAFEGADVVLHLACDNLRASLGAPMHTNDVNSRGTLTCALSAVDASVSRFVYVSSSEAYGSAAAPGPMSEDHPLLPTTVYGASKAAGELVSLACMRTYGMQATVVRPFNTYGPREHAHGTSAEVIPKFTSRIRAGQAPVVFGDGDQTRDFTWVEETAAGIVAAGECDDLVGRAVNVARGVPVSILDIAQMLLEELDAVSLAPEFADERPGDVKHHWADTERCKTKTGFEAEVSIREGLQAYVRWLSETDGDQLASQAPVENW